MPTCPYNVYDGSPYYWSVLDSSPGTQVWSTDAGAFVPLADATYVAWLAFGCSPATIDTKVLLEGVLADTALKLYVGGRGRGYLPLSGVTQTLTAPLLDFYDCGPTVDGVQITLPPSNKPNSRPLGEPTVFRNVGTATFEVMDSIGNDIGDVPPGMTSAFFTFSFDIPTAGTPKQTRISPTAPFTAKFLNLNVAVWSSGAQGFQSAFSMSFDDTLAGNSDNLIPSQKAIKTYADAGDTAARAYADSLAVNLGKRARVRAATTANITISTALNNADVLDGVTLATGNYVLVKNQTAPEQNGVYVVGVTPVRASEFDTYNEHPGSLIAVEEGTANVDTLWLCTSNDGGTLNTTAIAFSKMVIAGELLAANNLSEIANATTARTNLGISTRVQGRMSLVSATPYMTTSQSAKTTLYWMPDEGNQCPIYDGTNMVPTTFSEISVSTTDTTKSPAAIGASKINDWFFWKDPVGDVLRIGHGPDRASDTAAADVVTVNGIDLNATSITNGPAAQRGTWIGTTRSNASSQIDYIFGAVGTAGWFGLCNRYNRRKVASTSAINTTSWTYSTGTTRESNGSSTARVSFVQCKADDVVEVMHVQRAQAPAVVGNTFYSIGFALDSTTVFDKQVLFLSGANALISVSVPAANSYTGLVGFHFVAPTEAGDGTNTYTIYAQQFQSFRVVLNL